MDKYCNGLALKSWYPPFTEDMVCSLCQSNYMCDVRIYKMDIMENPEKIKIVLATLMAVVNLYHPRKRESIITSTALDATSLITPKDIPSRVVHGDDPYQGDLGLPPPKRCRGRPRKVVNA